MSPRILASLLALVGCQQHDGPAANEASLAEMAMAQGDDLAACGAIAFTEAADICRLDLGVRLARDRVPDGASEACQAITHELWKEECFFRTAEVIGRRVNLEIALQNCAKSGRYASYCFIHSAWWSRHFPELPSTSDATLAQAIAQYMDPIETLSTTETGRYFADGVRMVRAATWFGAYYGSGLADPTAAKHAVEKDQPAARTAFAWEAIRLINEQEGWKDLPAKVEAVWSGERPPPTGSSMPSHCWRGRVADVTHVPDLKQTGRTYTIHGGLRLVGDNPADDLRIAILEAMLFIPEMPPDAWSAGLNHSALTVRATAARLGSMSSGQDGQWREQLSTLSEPIIREQVLAARRQPASVWTASPDREECP